MPIDTQEVEPKINNGEPEVEPEIEPEVEPTKDTEGQHEGEVPEAKLARLERQAKQLRKKLGVAEPESKKAKKSDEIDYAQQAFLAAYGIKEADERELLDDRMVNTGKSLKEVIEDKYFKQDLQELRSAKVTKLATPASSNRSGTSARDTVDYWRAKIDSGAATLFDIPDIKLRRQIVNSKMQQAKDVNHFTNNPFGTVDIK